MKDAKLQSGLVQLLRPKIEHLGVVESEVAFRALPEYDLRGADVAFVSRQRWQETPGDDNLRGSPEIVIEILPPSNTKSEMREKSALYLSTGALQFWIVDPKDRAVTVMQRGGSSVLYKSAEVIPLITFGSDSITVDQIFG